MADDCFGPESGGSATRPLTSGSTGNPGWITAETSCGAGDGSRILELLNSIVANLRNICRYAAGLPLIQDDPCDTAIIDAIVKAPCVAPLADAAEIDAICAAPDTHYFTTCTADGKVVRVPIAKLVGADGLTIEQIRDGICATMNNETTEHSADPGSFESVLCNSSGELVVIDIDSGGPG